MYRVMVPDDDWLAFDIIWVGTDHTRALQEHAFATYEYDDVVLSWES